jgi:hypothetical protein
MTHRTAEESKQANIEAMGPDLGAQFSELWQRVVRAHVYWEEYMELFGKRERVDLLNQSAPAFFNMLQNELSDIIVLHLTRLTDKPEMFGQKNLTVRNLASFIKEEAERKEVEKLAEAAFAATKSCRARRNRAIAHDDLSLALNDKKARPLDTVSRKEVDDALAAIASVMNAVSMYVSNCELMFAGLGPRVHGAVELLYVMRDGVKVQVERETRMRSGKGTPEDYKRDSL